MAEYKNLEEAFQVTLAGEEYVIFKSDITDVKINRYNHKSVDIYTNLFEDSISLNADLSTINRQLNDINYSEGEIYVNSQCILKEDIQAIVATNIYTHTGPYSKIYVNEHDSPFIVYKSLTVVLMKLNMLDY